MIGHFDWAGGREAMLRLGPDAGAVVIVALPAFEEANRTRTFAVTVMRALATGGIGSVLPDLPGTNDSLMRTEDATLAGWRAAFAAAARATGARWSVAIRSGALIDAEAELAGRWQLAPQDGAGLCRELDRLRQAGSGASDDTVEIAGNRVSGALLDELRPAVPSTARVVRLASDAQPADLKLDGPPLWRRAEPDNDPGFAAVLARDIAAWIGG
ncbi:hypothetical protein SAMN06297144_2733 [Sphingomonas guangdongensis]|uniref:Uncharacterized protein n=1 Tax=Sphingomonas guangdongensis TaxID=1141890 RepID=A0A285R1F6_9SPHN|nr:hypothetical protein [Sphingomonas guangdongensis]SOB87598.1 hypothetical protein SAMN06297144_2733 [Sphingomonas guangdongensis]